MSKHKKFNAAKFIVKAGNETQTQEILTLIKKEFETQSLEQQGAILRAFSLAVVNNKITPDAACREWFVECSEFKPDHIVEQNFGPVK